VAPQGFKTFGEQLMAVCRAAAAPSMTIDRRLETRAGQGASEGIDDDGGFLVQQSFADQILARMYGRGQLLSRYSYLPFPRGRNGVKIPAINETSRANGSRWGAVQSYWVPEGTAPTASRPKFRGLQMTANKVIALVYVTDELFTDSNLLGAYVDKACT